MIVTTTPTVEGRMATEYLGLVTGEAIMGANIFRDMFAGIRDIVGGRAGAYENVLRGGRDQAISELIEEAQALGADAVIGVAFSYSAIGASDSMLMVAVSGTAVKLA
ncbi:heavy metal-binding domain-containing protein [Polymorphobacter fuscus]|uniref:UPF0145 protein F3168_09770 n=1 Tax=Sandarakinorhabdus fusca TaxID=1439888 RepID=A0A7C9KZ16_9SPHN|nr:heavy metal-binding domain-containing protein [Polymorphobacter fuscus]KAB7646597.1 heavy metal-binding domain-containing protein [Polymorphobacter fuscus]MQT17548.1 heavy metal-binding domain-containing protein [Polymorphobacter fuscus]